MRRRSGMKFWYATAAKFESSLADEEELCLRLRYPHLRVRCNDVSISTSTRKRFLVSLRCMRKPE